MSIAYDSDFYGWVQEQAALLRAGHVAEADLEHLVEELESMGSSERRELESRLEVLFLHLLKWRFQPARRGQGWVATIREQRKRIAIRLRKSPSLKAGLSESVVDAYDVARIMAERETGLPESTFPPVTPWGFEQAMQEDFLPE